MEQPITIGVDLAKSVFQLHGIDAEGAVVLKRQVRRSQMLEIFQNLRPCLVGMEACAGAHHWARALGRFGHDVRLMPPSYVKPYDRRGVCQSVPQPVNAAPLVSGVEDQMRGRPQALVVVSDHLLHAAPATVKASILSA